MNSPRTPETRRNRRISLGTGRLAMFALAAALLLAQGCKTDDAGTTTTRTTTRTTPVGDEAPIIAQVEKTHVIGPNAAREIDYRMAWQHLDAGRDAKLFVVERDSVFVLDSRNYLSRIRIADGNRLWRMQIAEPIELMLGINFTGERVYVTTGGAVLALDAGTGSQIDKQPLRHIANTQPTVFGEFLIYGSRSGLIVWHSGQIGYQWRGYKIAHAVEVPPLVAHHYVVAVGTGGEIFVLNATDARQLWSKKLLAPVVAQPAVSEGSVFVAGTDQYLSAYDLGNGRRLWWVLTDSQLTDSPTVIGDRVYQRIPRHGLFCYAAHPPDAPAEQLIWKSPEVDGNVIHQRRSELFVWNKDAKRLTLADANRGSAIKTLNLPAVRQLALGGEKNDEIFAISDDGRVVRLVPRN